MENNAKNKKLRSLLVEIRASAEQLTKKDIGYWRRAWQMAINPDNPQRYHLYDIYRDTLVDAHLNGCITQRKNYVKRKTFKIVDKKGKENEELTQILESPWFKDFVDHALDSIYFGHSLVQFNNITIRNGSYTFDSCELVPRRNVIPEYGVVVRDVGDDPKRGISYRNGIFANSCVEIGKRNNLGILLKVAPQAISKKNMMAYWDMFGEIFGMPIRIGKTSSRDSKEITKTEKFLKDLGAAGWALFPEGTELEIKETSRGDAFNVYDKRIDRANSEISKAILGQTMTIDSGSSLSQSEVHLEVFNNLIDADADMLRDTINHNLLPFLVSHGFPLQGFRFEWNEMPDYTPEQQIRIEDMLLRNYDIDPAYFAEKYNIKILGKKEIPAEPSLTAPDDRFFV